MAPITDDTKHELHAASDAHKVVASVAKNIAAIGFTTNFILKTSIYDRQIDYKIGLGFPPTISEWNYKFWITVYRVILANLKVVFPSLSDHKF